MNDDLIARAKAAIEEHTWHDGEKLYDLVVDLVARCEQAETATERAASTPCVSCDRLAVVDGFCLPCGAGVELALTEVEREQSRNIISEFFTDEDVLPSYRAVDALWLALYRAGFDIMRRPVAGSLPDDGSAMPS